MFATNHQIVQGQLAIAYFALLDAQDMASANDGEFRMDEINAAVAALRIALRDLRPVR